MSVYFAQVGRYVKVGFSENPERRVANLFKSSTRYGVPRDLDIHSPRHFIASVPGGLNEERQAHIALSDFRVWGEWFLDEPEVRDFIGLCVDCDGIAAFIPKRPAGKFDWQDDPALCISEEEQRGAADAISRALARALTT